MTDFAPSTPLVKTSIMLGFLFNPKVIPHFSQLKTHGQLHMYDTKLQCGCGYVMSLYSILALLLCITTKTWVCGTICGSS